MKLDYFKGDMNNSATVHFVVKAQELPFVRMLRVSVKDDKVVFEAVIWSSLSDIKVEWSCQENENGELTSLCLYVTLFTAVSTRLHV